MILGAGATRYAGRVSLRLLSAAVVVACLTLPGAAQPTAQTGTTGPAFRLVALPSMRVVAESRPDVLGARLAPGSLMKAVTLAAALEHGVANSQTRILCRRTIDVDGRPLTCVHPDFHRALDPVEALAHSCNVYFATLASRLPRTALDDMLVRAGLRPSAPAASTVRAALGLDGVGATPRELLDAFCRMADVGPTRITLADETRRVLRLGFEGAARTGTADALARAGFSGLAKTGTAPMPGGGYHGIVAAVVNTDLPTHAIVVVAPGGTGAQAAALAADVLVRHGVPRRGRAESAPPPSDAGIRRPDVKDPVSSAASSPAGGFVRVGRFRPSGRYDVSTVAIEDYVAQGIAGEGEPASAPAAAQALAIAVRTFAVVNRGRHEREGFDLCDLTHCLSLRAATSASRAAAASTADRILTHDGKPADVYWSAWCGGHTERPSQVWAGATDPAWLPAQPDPFCAGLPGWTADLREVQVRQVLQAAGLRGGRVEGLRVVARTSSGRADRLQADGMVPDTVAGTVFRATTGRLLGWQLAKSTRFEIRRTAAGYRLTGTGLGHGVGLCVRGAGVRAAAGASAATILAAYFPGLAVTTLAPATAVRVMLPESDREQLPAIRSLAVSALTDLAAKLDAAAPAAVDLRFHPTVESYTRATGLPWWTAARTRGPVIDLLPADVLGRRGVLEASIRHELTHVLTEASLAGRPLWAREGLAQVMAGESPSGPITDGPCPADADLRDAASPDAWRLAYAAAGRCVARALAAGTPWRELGR